MRLYPGFRICFMCLYQLVPPLPDGIRRDVTYHLFVSYATWGDRPPPPLLAMPITPGATVLRCRLNQVDPLPIPYNLSSP
jgi:hypothetical protein